MAGAASDLVSNNVMLLAVAAPTEENPNAAANPNAGSSGDPCLARFDPHVLWFVGHGDVRLANEPTLGWTRETEVQPAARPAVSYLSPTGYRLRSTAEASTYLCAFSAGTDGLRGGPQLPSQAPRGA